MTNIISWKNNILFKTTCEIIEGNVEKLRIIIKYPRSDFRQKIKKINSEPIPNGEEFIDRGSYELCTYDFDPLPPEIEISTSFNAKLTPKKYNISNSPFPYILERDFLYYYLQPTELVEADNEEIKELGQNLTALTKKLPQVFHRIISYFHRCYKFDPEYQNKRQSALETLKSERGSCEDINHLFNALCRSLMIPSRLALGFSKGGSGWARHVWSEIYDPQFGWFPIDILHETPQVGYLDVSHLKTLTALDSSEPEIHVEYEYPKDEISPELLLNHQLFIDKTMIPARIEIKSKI